MFLVLLILVLSLNSCTLYAQAQSYRYIYPQGYERFPIEQYARNTLISAGTAYALYHIIQSRNMASQPIPQPNYQPPPRLWHCFATVTWPETQLSARESYIGPMYSHLNYAIAHTQAYKHCKALGATFSTGCKVTCYQ